MRPGEGESGRLEAAYVNDSLGHLSGDEVLVAVARRIQGVTRGIDTVARLSGDEFVVLCPDLLDVDAAMRRAHEIADVIGRPIALSSGRRVTITASVGVSFVHGDVLDPEEVLRDADVAMYRAKERGRARVELFDDALRVRAQQRRDIESDLRLAIEQQQFSLRYQPIASIRDRRIVGVEALVRWEHPRRGEVAPNEFIPIAEETGLVVPLDTWVLQEACWQMAAWRSADRLAADAHVSVNLSGRQLGDGDLVSHIAGALERSGLAPDALWLEITESTLMDDAVGAARTLTAIRELGAHLVIDDFGTGYSSLAYLKRFPVDALKIDRSFVDGLGRDPESEAIVQAVVGLARSLRLIVVAEGVETGAQLAQLRRLGADTCQGYLVARPMRAVDVAFDLTVPSPFSARSAGAAGRRGGPNPHGLFDGA